MSGASQSECGSKCGAIVTLSDPSQQVLTWWTLLQYWFGDLDNVSLETSSWNPAGPAPVTVHSYRLPLAVPPCNSPALPHTSPTAPHTRSPPPKSSRTSNGCAPIWAGRRSRHLQLLHTAPVKCPPTLLDITPLPADQSRATHPPASPYSSSCRHCNRPSSTMRERAVRELSLREP